MAYFDNFKVSVFPLLVIEHETDFVIIKIVCHFQFLPNSDDSILVSGAADSNIRVHDLNTKETTNVFTCHVSRVKRLATAPNLTCMFWSAAEDGCVM